MDCFVAPLLAMTIFASSNRPMRFVRMTTSPAFHRAYTQTVAAEIFAKSSQIESGKIGKHWENNHARIDS